jgi:hypothetical protein
MNTDQKRRLLASKEFKKSEVDDTREHCDTLDRQSIACGPIVDATLRQLGLQKAAVLALKEIDPKSDPEKRWSDMKRELEAFSQKF